MKVDIDPINERTLLNLMASQLSSKNNPALSKLNNLSSEELQIIVKKELPDAQYRDIIDELNKIAEASKVLGKKVSLSFNDDINRIIITISDKETNRIIQEIPCSELQSLAKHLKEATGILYDMTA